MKNYVDDVRPAHARLQGKSPTMRCFALYEDTADLARGAGCPEAETRGTRDGTAAKAAQPRSRGGDLRG